MGLFGGGGFISQVANMGLSAIPGVGQYMAAGEANQANAQMAENQMKFQEEMSNSAYQRATEDMRKAGLNPMLAYSQGGASTPSGAMAVMQPKVAAGLASSAMEALSLKKELQNKDSQIALNEAAAAAKKTEQRLNQSAAKIKEAQLPAVAQSAKTEAKIQKINETMAVPDAVGSRAGSVLNNVSGGIGRIIKGIFGSSAKSTAPKTSITGPNGYVKDNVDF